MDEISREMVDVKRYPSSPSLGMTQLSNGEMLSKQQRVEAIDRKKSFRTYFNLGITVKAGEWVTLKDGRTLNQQQCFVEAIGCDNRYGIFYCKIGHSLTLGESVTLKDGRTLNKQQCFVEAIDCQPGRCGIAYCCLGVMLDAGESVWLKCRRRLTKRQCYVEAIMCAD